MNRIYELVEDGAADEYDVQRLRGLQSQLHIVDANIFFSHGETGCFCRD